MVDTYISIAKLDDKEFLDRYTAKRDAINSMAKDHIQHLMQCEHGGIDLDLPCFLPVNDSRFELPSKEVVAKTVNLLVERGYSKNTISECVGISTTGSNRLLNYWLKEDSDRNINKSNWIVLASMAGLILPMMLKNK